MTHQVLKQQMATYFAKITAKGIKLTEWTCPYCNKPNKTRQPKNNEVTAKGYWDSAKMCYECGSVSFVQVYPNGSTRVFSM